MSGMKTCPYCNWSGEMIESVSMRILMLRQKMGWTQKDLARNLGITRSQVANIETGRSDVTSTILLKLSDNLGVTVD